METNKLRGLIYSRHRSLSEFSKAIGWDVNKVKRIASGQQRLTNEDLKKIAVHFKLNQQEFLGLFFDGLFKEGGNK